MAWRSLAGAWLVVPTATLVSMAGAAQRSGRIVGHVRECNTPISCIIQPFTVSARNRAGATVARTTTTGNNYFALRLPAGHYALTAHAAGGLACHASATAVAIRTVHLTITCLVP